MTANIANLIIFISAIVLLLLFPTKNEHNPQPPLLPKSLVKRSHKKSATTAAMAMDTAGHRGRNVS